mgnify:CR=1 FL=1
MAPTNTRVQWKTGLVSRSNQPRHVALQNADGKSPPAEPSQAKEEPTGAVASTRAVVVMDSSTGHIAALLAMRWGSAQADQGHGENGRYERCITGA